MRNGLGIALLAAFAAWPGAAHGNALAATPPPNFVFEDAAPGANLDVPTSIAFFPDGRILVAEKAGRAQVIQDGIKRSTPLWDATGEILSNGDRGLLCVAVDPRYALTHYVYFCYVVDPDSDGVDDNDVAFGRVTRYRTSVADSNVVDPDSRTVLLGASWADGVPDGSDSHTIDALRWGSDGSLLLSTGEGALYARTDGGGLTPNLFLPGRMNPYEDIGSFRAQSLSSLGGKILRIDPDTGHGYASNPYFDGDPNSSRSKVYAYGLRNPWRFTAKPGTGSAVPGDGHPGTLYIDNVGLNLWEALCVVHEAGPNFGWPCYEGPEPNPSAYSILPTHNDCTSMGTPDNPAQYSPPAMYYHHTDPALSSPPGLTGNGITCGIFYTGSYYPPQYRGAYFFADFGPGWMMMAVMDSTDHAASITPFATELAGPVDFAADPLSGDLYYISIYENAVKHLRWTGPLNGDDPPTALASGAPTLGTPPLPVSFSSAGSADINGDSLTYNWNFGDGQGSTLANPTHTYSTGGVYYSVLTVGDGHGGSASDSVFVVAPASASFPTTNVLDDFNRSDGPVGATWVGGTAALSIAANKLALFGGGGWGLRYLPVFGPNQEAYFTFATAPAPAGQYNLFLKSQTTNLLDGCLRVSVDSLGATVSTYDPADHWVIRGGPYAAGFASGDRLGVRAYLDGSVQVLKNMSVLATLSIRPWPFFDSGGRVGLELVSSGASRIDDFGGGEAAINGNLPPSCSISSPITGTFYAAGDTIRMIGSARDDRDPLSALRFRWDVDLNHNNHVHPDAFVAASQTGFFIAQNHDDGTGVSLSLRIKATDTEGLSGTIGVQIWPEVDLQALSLTTIPDTVTMDGPAIYRFQVCNAGRMPSPFSHWQITASNGTTLAQGDTLVPALSTITVQRTLPPVLLSGRYTLRATVDTLGAVHETSEANNAVVKALLVNSITDAVEPGPGLLSLSRGYPNPGHGEVTLALDLPREALVEMRVFDLQGREQWRMPAQTRAAGHWSLAWPGRRSDGGAARPGLYLARVKVGGETYTRRIALLQ